MQFCLLSIIEKEKSRDREGEEVSRAAYSSWLLRWREDNAAQLYSTQSERE